MALDPNRLSSGTFGVPELTTEGMKITGVSKKALSGDVAVPKESAELVKDLVARVKKTGSKTDATIQITKEYAAKLHANQDPAALKTLQKFVSDVKSHLVQRESSKTLGFFRVALSRLLGGIGKLEKLEKELALIGVEKPKQVAVTEPQQPKKEELPKDFPAKVTLARKEALARVFPEGLPVKAGPGPANAGALFQNRESPERGALPSSDLCSPVLSAEEVTHEMREYAALLGSNATNFGDKIFKLVRSEKEPNQVTVVAGTIDGRGKLKTQFKTEPLPVNKSPKQFLEALQKQYGVPLIQEVREKIIASKSEKPEEAVFAPPTALEMDEKERAQMAEMREQVRALKLDDSRLSTLPKEQALQALDALSQKIMKLQEAIIRDVEGGETRVVAVYKHYMESCFAASVAIQERVQLKKAEVERRGENREQEARAQSKLFPEHPELCRQLSNGDTKREMEVCLQGLLKTNEGKRFVEKNSGRFFELSMDYDHPTRIQIIAGKVKPTGKVTFSKQAIEIKGERYEYEGRLHTKQELLKALKQDHGEPIDMELRSIAPTLALRPDIPPRIA